MDGAVDFSFISDEDLDDYHMSELSMDFSFCGEGMMKYLLQERGIKQARSHTGFHCFTEIGEIFRISPKPPKG